MELGYPYDFGPLRCCYHPRLVPRCFPAWSPQVSKSSQTLLKIRWHLGSELSLTIRCTSPFIFNIFNTIYIYTNDSISLHVLIYICIIVYNYIHHDLYTIICHCPSWMWNILMYDGVYINTHQHAHWYDYANPH
jgi:hypothetical protein